MSINYECLSCGEKFDSTTLYCEDWRDPNRSLGCPNCKTFFKAEMRAKKWSWQAITIGLIVLFAIVGFVFIYDVKNKLLAVGAVPIAQVTAYLINHIILGAQKLYVLKCVEVVNKKA